MLIFKDIDPIKTHLFSLKSKGQTIGFVPTMGALHAGHTSLIEESNKKNDVTVCSIYVNPTQFNKETDLANYPRVLNQDIKILEEAGCDILFAPSDHVMYQHKHLLSLNFGYLETIMEGRFRKGHFKGVGIIIAKFLNIIQPTNLYMGQKDLQQFIIVKQLIEDFSFDVNLICMPIVREPDGLAMSSRNGRLADRERNFANLLYKALLLAKSVLIEHNNVILAKEKVVSFFTKNDVIKLEYFEVLDSNTLEPVENLEVHKQISLFIAGYLGEIRLIDNIYLH